MTHLGMTRLQTKRHEGVRGGPRLILLLLTSVLFVSGFGHIRAETLRASALRAGAAKLDITPSDDAALVLGGYGDRTQGFAGIHDPIYVRAIVFRAGETAAAIICGDLVGYSDDFRAKIFPRLERETGISPDHVLITATHTHGAPWILGLESDPEGRRYVERVADAVVEAVRLAQRRMRPAVAGAGAGRANVNINRVARMADGAWWLGLNPEGPSDKSLAVVRIDATDGQPIALLINQAVHGTAMGQENLMLTGDLPGAVSRFVERDFNDDFVAMWTSGAGGDQCPIYDRVAEDFRGMEAMGRATGEEVLRVAKEIRTGPVTSVAASRAEVACPGRRFLKEVTHQPLSPADFEPGPEVSFKLSALAIGKIILAGVSGEPFSNVGTMLKRQSPYVHTLLIAHANGAASYLPDREGYDHIGYEVQVAEVQAGCAEDVIIPRLLQMIEENGDGPTFSETSRSLKKCQDK